MTDRLFDIPALEASPIPMASSFTGMGAAAEMMLAAALLERGHKVAVPICDDDGVDLIVDYRLKVQVKCSEHRNPTSGRLMIAVHRPRYRKGRRVANERGIADHVDVLAVRARDTGVWWFIPRDQLTQRRHLYLLETAHTGPSAWREAWAVFGNPIPTAPSTYTSSEADA